MGEEGDKLLTCVDCSVQFIFTAREQAFYQERGYQPPRRCKNCREKRKTGGLPSTAAGALGGAAVAAAASSRSGSSSGLTATADAAGEGRREQFKVNCTSCGIETTVPFKPDPNRPVYCRTCYLNRRKAQ